jgi:hypothetical protein
MTNLGDEAGSLDSTEMEGKTSKAVNLHSEMIQKLKGLSGERWEHDVSSRGLDGLRTRCVNTKHSYQDAGIMQHDQMLTKDIEVLNAIVDFGTIYKKQYMKTQKDAALKFLYAPLTNLLQAFDSSEELKAIAFHPSMSLLTKRIKVHTHFNEGRLKEALQGLDVDEIATLNAGQMSVLPTHRVLGVQFVLNIVEKLFNQKSRGLKCDKQFGPTLLSLLPDFEAVAEFGPTMPHVPTDIRYEERCRAERLEDQLTAIVTLSKALLAHVNDSPDEAPWPSVSRAALNMLTDPPLTEIAQGFSSYAGAKQFKVRANSLLQRSSADEAVVKQFTLFADESSAQVLKLSIASTLEEFFVLGVNWGDKFLLRVAEQTQHLNSVTYEDAEGNIQRLLGVLCSQVLAKCNGKLSTWFADSLKEHIGKLLLLFPDTYDVSATAKDDAVATVAEFGRVLNKCAIVLQSRNEQSLTFYTTLKSYMNNTLSPKARDRFEAYADMSQGMRAYTTGQVEWEDRSKDILLALTCIYNLLTFGFKQVGGGVPNMRELVDEWHTWAANQQLSKLAKPQTLVVNDLPFVECVLSLTNTKQKLEFARLMGSDVGLAESLEFICESHLPKLLVDQLATSRLEEAVTLSANASSLAGLHDSPAESYMSMKEGRPNGEGMHRVDLDSHMRTLLDEEGICGKYNRMC